MTDAPRPVYFAVDLVIRRGEKVLFVIRKYPPFEGMLALPGGFVEPDETAEQAAVRELKEETGIDLTDHQADHLFFLKLSSRPDRDPRGRVISAAYLAVVQPRTKAIAGDDARETIWLTPKQALRRGLAFDHAEILSAVFGEPVIGLARYDREEADSSTSVWYGLRPAVRARLSRAVQHLRERGSLRRSDIEYLGEVSTPQASNDIAEIQKRLPDLMRYDPSAKCYVLTDSNQGNTDEPDEQQQDSMPG